jgi:hypothetical protein
MSGRIIPALEDGVERRAGIDFGVVPGFQKPPFVLIGSDDTEAASLAAALYRRIIAKETAVHFLSTHDAELAKLAFNVFLCLKISFGNSLAQLSDRLGSADIDAIANILSLDPRIGAGLLGVVLPMVAPVSRAISRASFTSPNHSVSTHHWCEDLPRLTTHNMT